jgi:outer membrane protein assembly factor BamB
MTSHRRLLLSALLTSLLVGALSGCGDDEPPCCHPPRVPGPLEGTTARVPSDPAAKRLLVNGAPLSVLATLDGSGPGTAGIPPAEYALPLNVPAAAPASQWNVGPLPTPASTSYGMSTAGYVGIHGDLRNSDEVITATVPEFELNWVAETGFYLPEGPSVDSSNRLYMSPIEPAEDVLMVSVDGDTGLRRWQLDGRRAGQGGAPLVLADSQGDIVYTGSYEYLTAVRPDGRVMWDVQTTLSIPEGTADAAKNHLFGINYQDATDALIGVYASGEIVVHDRATGTPLAEPFVLPGAIAPAAPGSTVNPLLQAFLNPLIALLFDERQAYYDTLKLVLGGDSVVANYFAVVPDSRRILVAATAPDEQDGTTDGISQFGALYCLELTRRGDVAEWETAWRVDFSGGSAATPTVSLDGTRVYTADDEGRLLAYAVSDGRQLWSVDTGSGQIVGSVAVAADRGEIYAATRTDVVKFIDMGSCAGNGTTCNTPVWNADFESLFDVSVLSAATQQQAVYAELEAAIEDFFADRGTPLAFVPQAGNLVIAGISANAVAVQAGYGWPGPTGALLPFQVAHATLDRDTGALRYVAGGVEESISTMVQGPRGDMYLAHSPLRRTQSTALLRAVGALTANPRLTAFGWNVIGGVSRLGPRQEGGTLLLGLEAADIAERRLENYLVQKRSGSPAPTEAALQFEQDRIRVLLRQALDALERAVQTSEYPASSLAATARIETELAASRFSASRLLAAIEAWRVATAGPQCRAC